MGNKLCVPVRARKKKGKRAANSQPPRPAHQSSTSLTGSAKSDKVETPTDPQLLTADVNSSPGKAVKPAKSSSQIVYTVWYGHTGQSTVEFPTSNGASESKLFKEITDVKDILKDVGEHDITHLSIKYKFPPSLNDIAPNLTHLEILDLEDHSELESLRDLQQLEVLILSHHHNFSNGLPSVVGELTSLRELHAEDCGLDDLPRNLGQLKRLQVLNLGKNSYHSGLPDVIGELVSLTHLELDYCGLSDLPQSLTGLRKLKVLDISKNLFLAGLPLVVDELVTLTELNINHCQLTNLPPSVVGLKELRVLNLSNNQFLSILPEVIPKLSSLTELKLRRCLLQDLPPSLDKLKQLKVLDVQENSFGRLPGVIGELVTLEELNLRLCNLKTLPDNLGQLKQLKVLNLQTNNFLKGLPSVVGQLTSLTKLNLFRCSLRELPPSLFALRNLEVLNLEYNSLKGGLPNEIGDLCSLKELFLTKCSLTDLPQRFCELQELKVLVLDYNNFSGRLPAAVGELSSLIKLNVKQCSLTDLPSSLAQLTNLSSLNLEQNCFPNGIPSVIGELTSLAELNLSRCSIFSLPQSLDELKQLKMLSLTGNDFSSEFPTVICDMTMLSHLDLSHCSLLDVPQRLNNLENLKFLNLTANNLSKVPLAVFELKELMHLNVSENQKLSDIDERILQLKSLLELGCDECESLQSPPYQVCRQGIKAIRSYFVELAKGVEVSTIPVAIIGNSLSGKTSIVRSLKEGKRELTYREEASPLDELTKVFNVEELKFSNSHVRLIDYGGQEIYHIAYHLALKEQCVPLIVVNIFEFFTRSSSVSYEEATREVCFDWLCHLYLACPNLGRPLLALTHTDKLSAEELEDSKDALKKTVDNIRRRWLEEEERCKDLFEVKFKQIKHLSNVDLPIFLEEDIFQFNNDTNITSNIECLKENIGRRCLSLEHNIPQSWKEVSAFLEKASDEPYMEFSAITKQFPDMDCKTALEYMHHTGKILWFQRKTDGHDELAGYVFHQIPMITKMMALLFHHSPEEMKSDCLEKFREFTYKDTYIGRAKYEKLLKEFLSAGVLDESLLYNLVVSDSGFDFKVAAQLLRCFYIVHGPFKLRVSKTPRDVYTVPCFATKPMDHSWKTTEQLQLRFDIVFNGLPLPKYAYQLTSVSVLNRADQFDIVDARSNGAIAKHEGNATYLCHDPKAGKVTLQVSSSIEQLSNSWVRLRKTAEDIIDVISKRWEATRVEVKHYCVHCLFLRDVDPGIEVNPDWFPTKQTYDGLQMVACYKGEERTVPKPLMFPCSNFSSEEITRLDSYLKGMQSTHSSSS